MIRQPSFAAIPFEQGAKDPTLAELSEVVHARVEAILLATEWVEIAAILRHRLENKQSGSASRIAGLPDHLFRSSRRTVTLAPTCAGSASARRERERRVCAANRKSERRRLDDEAHRRACQQEEHQRAQDPRGAAEKAIDLARVALVNGGLGLSTANSWLQRALQDIACRGQVALDVNVSHLFALADTDELRRWLQHHVNDAQPSSRSVRTDLLL